MLVEIIITVNMIIICFILNELATMIPYVGHLSHLVDNTDTFYLGHFL